MSNMNPKNPMGIIRRVTVDRGVLTPRYAPHLPRTVNRRAFLRGVSSVAIGLPFLESLQSHSAWAQNAQPVFSFFICGANGVIGNDFHPSAAGPLNEGTLGKNTKVLAPFADKVIMLRGIKFPANMTNCGHAQGASMVLTGTAVQGGGNTATSGSESADTYIAKQLNNGVDPISLYSGHKEGFINERLSFVSAGQVRPAESSPQTAFQRIFDQASDAGFGGGGTPAPAPVNPSPSPGTPANMAPVLDDLTARRKSVVDLVRDELMTLQGRQGLNAGDKARLDTHLSSLRKIEIAVGEPTDPVPTEPGGVVTNPPSAACSADIDASHFAFTPPRGMSGEDQEKTALLHMEIVAFAFACNLNRTATLQIGDGTDHAIYNVPNNTRGWKFHHISHRAQSDGNAGNDQQSVVAHSEIDGVRMATLAKGIEAFNAYGLLDSSFIMWTNHVSDGPSHSFADLPFVIAGSAGGYLKTGQAIRSSNENNSKVLATLIAAMGLDPNGFAGGKSGIIDAMKA